MKNLSLIIICLTIIGCGGSGDNSCCNEIVIPDDDIISPTYYDKKPIKKAIEKDVNFPLSLGEYSFHIEIYTKCKNIVDAGMIYINVKTKYTLDIEMDDKLLKFNAIEQYLHSIADFTNSDTLLVNGEKINAWQLSHFIESAIGKKYIGF